MSDIDYSDSRILHGLKEEHLTELTSGNGRFRLTPLTAEAFTRMRNDALKDGINLCIASSFRNFERQKLIFEEKIAGIRKVLDRNERPVDISAMNRNELIRTIMFFSAVPGLSRHHWGTDLDVYTPDTLARGEELDLTNRCYSCGCQQCVGDWLGGNMHRYGFFRPYSHDNDLFSYELWHISYGPESDLFTGNLDYYECISFLREEAGLSAPETVIDIIADDFNERFKLLSPECQA